MSLEGCSLPSCPADEERASFFPRAETPFLIIGVLDFRFREILLVVGKRSN